MSFQQYIFGLARSTLRRVLGHFWDSVFAFWMVFGVDCGYIVITWFENKAPWGNDRAECPNTPVSGTKK